MQLLTLTTGQTLRYYSELDEFPAERRSYFTRYQIESAEIDLSPEAIAARIGGILEMNQRGEADSVAIALQNLLFSFNAIGISYAPDELSFGMLIADVDGVAVTDFTPDGLHRVISPLNIPVGTMARIVEQVKKNSQPTGSVTSLGLLGVFN